MNLCTLQLGKIILMYSAAFPLRKSFTFLLNKFLNPLEWETLYDPHKME